VVVKWCQLDAIVATKGIWSPLYIFHYQLV
jgi:hypothetical protein